MPPYGYLKAAADLCKAHNVLFIADEVQTGFGRAGFMLGHHREPGVRPDMVILGKALTGGKHLFRVTHEINQLTLPDNRNVSNVDGNGN